MIIVFPQATRKFNKLFVKMIRTSKAELFLNNSLSSYNLKKISKILIIILENKIVEKYLSNYFSNFNKFLKVKILVLKKETSGSICTLLMASSLLKNKAVIISALDQIILGKKKIELNQIIKKKFFQAAVPLIKSDNPLLCYAVKDDLGNVIQLFEKKLVSSDAILGIYFFKNFLDFSRASQELLVKFRGFKNRNFYTSDVINSLIMKDYNINFNILDLDIVKVRTLKDLIKIK